MNAVMYSILEIPLNFDPIALGAALFAIFFAMWESRKNNNVIVKIKDCSGGMKQDISENNSQQFFYFKIIVQNKGLPLHNISLSLSFSGLDHSGRFNYPIPMRKDLISDGVFAKGMIAEFELHSYKLRKDDILLTSLQDISFQKTTLCLYSQNYLATTFKIGGFIDKLQNYWNNIAHKLSFQRKISTSCDGHPVIKEYKLLPSFCTLEKHLRLFIEGSKEIRIRVNQC